MLVATTEGVLDFRREGPDQQWQLQDELLLEGKHVSALVYDEPTGLLFAGLHFEGGLLVSEDHGKSWEARNNGLNPAMPMCCWFSISAIRRFSISAPSR